ncbi:Tubulin alpha-2 chain [Venturia inaequalis]|nr:Tubulin alpha-2 chain [Venturia inaequalis]
MPLIPRSSYYDQHFRQSAALIRARRPFLFRNLATGAALVTFTTGVYAYTILAVAQDNFDDVVPGAPVTNVASGQTTEKI